MNLPTEPNLKTIITGKLSRAEFRLDYDTRYGIGRVEASFRIDNYEADHDVLAMLAGFPMVGRKLRITIEVEE